MDANCSIKRSDLRRVARSHSVIATVRPLKLCQTDDYLKIIPTSPNHVPREADSQARRCVARVVLPDGEEFESEVYDKTEFIDQGENIEAVICPSCKKRLNLDHFNEDDPMSLGGMVFQNQWKTQI